MCASNAAEDGVSDDVVVSNSSEVEETDGISGSERVEVIVKTVLGSIDDVSEIDSPRFEVLEVTISGGID